MKNAFKLLAFILLPLWANAQQSYSDSLRRLFKNAPNDSVKYYRSVDLAVHFQKVNVDSADYYAEAGVMLAHRNNQKIDEDL